jgi:circadian clock protein KaiB
MGSGSGPRGEATKRPRRAAAKGDQHGKYVLRLFVAGATTRSAQALEAVKDLCEQYLPGRYTLEVIDVYQQPIVAKEGQIIATPTLVKEFPEPLRRLVGSMSDRERVLVGLDIREQREEGHGE